MKLCVLAAVLVAIKLVRGLEESSFSEPEESQESDKTQQQQQGSWAHWWSYDGISGRFARTISALFWQAQLALGAKIKKVQGRERHERRQFKLASLISSHGS